MEATQMSTDRWMDKQDVLYTYNKLFSLKRGGNSVTAVNVEELWEYYVKWNKPVTKRQMLYDSISMSYVEWWKSWRQKEKWWLPGAEGRREWGFGICTKSCFFIHWISSFDLSSNSLIISSTESNFCKAPLVKFSFIIFHNSRNFLYNSFESFLKPSLLIRNSYTIQ